MPTYLRENPEEAQNLFSDLLISVTAFFRDPAAFEAVAHEVFRPLFENRDDGQGDDRRGDDKLRVWSVGCATGEEAYSLAILLLEEAERREVAPADPDLRHRPRRRRAGDGARGPLPEGDRDRRLARTRLRRFFVDEGTHYRIRKEVRDIVLFAHHSAVKDPPFLRLDLDHLPQPADLSRSRPAAPAARALPLCAQAGRLPVPRRRRERRHPARALRPLRPRCAALPAKPRGTTAASTCSRRCRRGHVPPLLKPVGRRAREPARCRRAHRRDARGAGAAERAGRRGSPRRPHVGESRALHLQPPGGPLSRESCPTWCERAALRAALARCIGRSSTGRRR